MSVNLVYRFSAQHFAVNFFQFDIRKINTHSCQLNPESLEECNRLDLIEQVKHPADQAKLVDEVKGLVKKAHPNEKNLDLSDDHIKEVLEWSLLNGRISNLSELVDEEFDFIWVLPEKSSHNLSQGELAILTIFVRRFFTNFLTDTLDKLMKTLMNVDNFEKPELSSTLKTFSKNENVKFAELMQSIRSILSGSKVESFDSVSDTTKVKVNFPRKDPVWQR